MMCEKMERKNIYICMLAALLSCSDSVKVSRTLDEMPVIFPDYNGVVIPPNMAPLNFALDDQDAGSRAVFSFGGQQFEVKGEKGSIVIPPSKWKNLLESAAGDSIQVTVQVKQGNEWVAYSPFTSNLNYLLYYTQNPQKYQSFLQNFPCCAKKRVSPLPPYRSCRCVPFAVQHSGRQRPLHPSFRRYVCKKARFFVRFVSCAQRHFSVQ